MSMMVLWCRHTGEQSCTCAMIRNKVYRQGYLHTGWVVDDLHDFDFASNRVNSKVRLELCIINSAVSFHG
jgi:hypothetical protein